MSGIAAGSGGLKVNVSGTTTLNGGSITSTADTSKNQITTGQLVGNSLDNHSIWSGLDVKGSETVSNKHGVGVIGTQNGQEVMGIPGNILGPDPVRPGIMGNSVSHDEHTVTDAVIGRNIIVNAGSTIGSISNDPEAANGHIQDHFDANKISNGFTLQNKAAEVMNNYGNLVINTIVNANSQTPDTSNVPGNSKNDGAAAGKGSSDFSVGEPE